MDFIHVIILGVVEGITEFIPVSSTGHLVIVERLLGLEPTAFLLSFTIAIQLGAIFAIAILYWKTLTRSWNIIWHLGVGVLPAIIAGLFFYPFIKSWLTQPNIVLWALAIGGTIMIVLERWILPKTKSSQDAVNLTYRTALLIGIFQALALVPGVSRSAATIIGGLVAGLSRSEAVKFSFLLALPTMIAATGLDLYQNASLFSSSQAGILILGSVVAGVTAMVSMRWLLSYLQKHDLSVFGYYRIAFAVVIGFLIL